MRLLYVIQRYGEEISGGAEAACRSWAERLAARGHEVEVLTSCATSYADWADTLPAGESVVNGVTVHRLPVRAPRSHDHFVALHHRNFEHQNMALPVQRDWLRVHGPDLPGLTPFLEQHSASFDLVIFYTYLFAPTALGISVAAARTATVVHPAAHDELPFFLDVFDNEFRLPEAISCHTIEEQELIGRRTKVALPTALIGLGVDVDIPADGARFRRRYGLGDRPYVVFVGRLDPGKAADELYRYMQAVHDRGTVDIDLVVVGEPVRPLPTVDRILITGFVDEQTKNDAIAGATVLGQPSYFESFSIALCEGWVHRRPALVQGWCKVLEGQARRSKGGIPYKSFGEFELALERIVSDPALARAMGESGHKYVVDNYQWPVVLDRYESFLHEARARFERRESRW